jgi:hypothetical protein
VKTSRVQHMPDDIPTPPIRPRSSGFLKSAGRSWSLGGQKKQQSKGLPDVPNDDVPPVPDLPWQAATSVGNGRARATTASTATTVIPPRLESDVNLDMGGDFSKLFLGFDKRSSVATVLNDAAIGHSSASRNLTGSRVAQPTPIHIDRTTKVEPSPYSWTSQHSNDRLLSSSPTLISPPNVPVHSSLLPGRSSPLASGPQRKPVPQGDSSLRRDSGILRRSSSAEEDEDAKLLKDSLSAVTRFMSGGNVDGTGSASRTRRDEDTASAKSRHIETNTSRVSDTKRDGDNLFDSSFAQAGNLARRYAARPPSPPKNKVMTPAQFERYRRDSERREIAASNAPKPAAGAQDNEDEDNYEDEDDEAEKAKQATKQRRKQEAHMTVYRQQMMKVTGESAGAAPSRPRLSVSFSTPNLPILDPVGPLPPNGSDEEEDEEVPLAILAAHGFPNKNRPPTRLSTVGSNPSLRASQMPSYQRPASVLAGAAGAEGSGRLPAFAKHLPKDPFLGAGLVHNPVRESFALGGGGPAISPGTMQSSPTASPGGLIGVIASEEKSRALRRGSPHIDGQMSGAMQPNLYDPINGIPANMMYPGGMPMPNPAMMTPGDHTQMQMNMQMQQFMQMQMQFMQMMAGQNPNGVNMNPMATQSLGHLPMMAPGSGLTDGGRPESVMRHSFVGDGGMPGMDPSTIDSQPRTMSMVGSGSAPWLHGMPQPGYSPSIRAQGMGYAPSIAPSERSNVGLPGRYRPVSQAPPPMPHANKRTSTAPNLTTYASQKTVSAAAAKPAADDDDDDDRAWANMKAKRDKKRSIWRSKKTLGVDVGALIS